jgi:hypothetical protein
MPTFAQSPPATNAKLRSTITVRMQNYAQVPSLSLARAETLASGILREAGVQVVWLDCNVGVTTEEHQSGCAQPLGSTDFVLSLTNNMQALSPKLPETAVGLAMVPSGGDQGYMAYVSYDRASNVARKGAVAVETVLGLAAAHELGHLLLGESAHYSSGLMKIWWGADELRLGVRSNMLFTPRQSERIRANVLARVEASQLTPPIQISQLK